MSDDAGRWRWSVAANGPTGATSTPSCSAASGGDRGARPPTAAAYEHPEKAVSRPAEWFAAPRAAEVGGLMVLGRADAEDEANAAVVRASRFIYLAGGSPMHLRRCSRARPSWRPSSRPGATVPWWPGRRPGPWCSPIPWSTPAAARSPSGLGMVEQLAVVPHFGDHENAEKVHRSIALAAAGPARGRASPSAPPSCVIPTAPGATRARRPPVVFVTASRTGGSAALRR